MAPGAQEVSLQYFADKGIADQVVPPVISMRDFDRVSGGSIRYGELTGRPEGCVGIRPNDQWMSV